MRVTLFGTRGSVPAPGPDTARYGGNTPSVEVRGDDGTVLVLDAGTGIRPLAAQRSRPVRVARPSSGPGPAGQRVADQLRSYLACRGGVRRLTVDPSGTEVIAYRLSGRCSLTVRDQLGDGGVAFVAEPQIPPRNVNWAAQGKWVHYAKIAFEKYFLHKIRRGESEPFYERWFMENLGIRRLTRTR